MAASPHATRHLALAASGLEAAPVSDLVQAQRDLVDRIRLAIGLDHASFDLEVLPTLEAYAGFVHLLPATACDYFDRPGGLFELGLKVGFYALQGTDAHIFAGQSSISTRRLLEPRWRHATLLAGLCCELHRALTTLVVTDAGGHEWPAYRGPLATWLDSQQAQRYFVHWRPKSSEARGTALFALPHVVTSSTLEYLDEGHSTVVPHLLASVAGLPIYREHNVLDSLVRRSLTLVIDGELRAAQGLSGAPGSAAYLERYLVEALRNLAANEPSWRPNAEKSRVWSGPEGAFIAWPLCAADLRGMLERNRLAGVPKTPEALLELMLSAGVAQRQGTASTWTITPPGARAAVVAVRLTSPALLWPSDVAECATPDQPPSESPAPPASQAASPTLPTQPTTDDSGQLSLLEQEPYPDPAEPAVLQAPRQGAASSPAQDSPTLALQTPLRLNPLVRDGLTSIIDTMNGPAREFSARTVAHGVFVPLAELELRGIQPALAIRGLGDLGMLIRDQASGSPTVTCEFGGRKQVGLVLHPRCVSGLDLAAFVLPEEGDR
jgi:conjugal transfer pilus assembly protein TraI